MLTLLAMAGVLLLFSCSGKTQETPSKSETPAATQAEQPQATAPAPMKKYDIKSGIVTFEDVFDIGSTQMKVKRVLYFDDYGMKECEEKFDDNGLKESHYSDGKELYTAMHAQKTVYHRGTASRGTAFRFDWEEISSSDRQSGAARQLPHMTVAGKDCESFEIIDAKGGTTTKFAGWNHVCLYTEARTKYGNSTMRAVKVEENVPVPAEKFGPPAGYQVKESQF